MPNSKTEPEGSPDGEGSAGASGTIGVDGPSKGDGFGPQAAGRDVNRLLARGQAWVEPIADRFGAARSA